MGDIFLSGLNKNVNNAPPLGPEEVPTRVVRLCRKKDTITKYKRLNEDSLMRKCCQKPSVCKRLGRLCQGFEDTEGIDIMRCLVLKVIKNTQKIGEL